MTYFVEQLQNGLSLGCIYALVALGFAMVFGVLRVLNFAHSEIFMSGTYIAYFALRALSRLIHTSPSVVVLLTVAVSSVGTGVVALFLERAAYRPIRHEPKLAALLTAIGASTLLQALASHAFSPHTRGFPPVDLPITPKQFAVLVLIVSYLVLRYTIYHSSMGVRIRAVAENPAVAELMGINPIRSIQAAFFIGGAFAGVAGVVWGLVYGTVNPVMGFYPGLKAFVIAVVGTVGDLRGTFIVGVGLGVLEALLGGYLPSRMSAFRDVVTFMILLAALAWRPAGLFGSAEPEKV